MLKAKTLLKNGIGSLVILVSSAVLVGWIIHEPRIIQLFPQFPPMQVNTAIAFIFSGVGIIGINKYKKMVGCIGTLIFIFSLLTIIEYVTGFDFKIDQIFLKTYTAAFNLNPGRMAPNTAFCFLLTSLIFIFEGFFHKKIWSNQLLVLLIFVVGLVGLTSLAGYLFQIQILYQWNNVTGIALHTAILMVLISIGLLPLAKDRFLQSSSMDSYLLCIIIAAIGIVVFLITWQGFVMHQNNSMKKIINREFSIIKNHLILHLSDDSEKIDINELIRDVFNQSILNDYGVELSNNHKVFYRHGIEANVFFQHQWKVTEEFSVAGDQWVLSIWPTEQFVKSESSNFPLIFLIFGQISVGLIVFILRLWQVSERKSKNLLLIDKITSLTANAKDTMTAIKVSLDLICESIGWPVGHVYMRKQNGDSVLESTRIWYLKFPQQSELFRQISEAITFKRGIGLPGRVWAANGPIWISDVHKDINFPRVQMNPDINVHAAIGFPVLVYNEVLAVYEFFLHEPKNPDYELLRIFKVLAEQISHVFERKMVEEKLNFIAYHDHLTGVSNRAQFEKLAEESLLRATRHKKLVAIIIIDLDGFKAVNDSFGHDVGDVLLKEMSKRFIKLIRVVDTFARIGGDEFAVIADFLEKPAGAEIVAKKIIEAARKPFCINQHDISLSVSAGVAIYPKHGDSVFSLMKNADIALYHAKKLGKNTFCVSDVV